MSDATFRGSLNDLQGRLALLPLILAGRSPVASNAAVSLAKALGIEALSFVKEAFVEKGRGGTDVAGIKWEPLSERYVAYHRRHKGLTAKRTRAAKAGRERRPLLTSAQDQLWRGVYASALRRGDDEGTAAAKAWGAVKRAGGKTIIGEYGKAAVEMGRDTGRLLGSLSPGGAENILDARPGSVRVGSNVVYAKWFHQKRKIWTDSGELPLAWQARLRAVLESALPAIVRELLRG